MASLIDYEDFDCPVCGHIGLVPDGGFDLICPVCETSYDLLEEEDDLEDDSDE